MPAHPGERGGLVGVEPVGEASCEELPALVVGQIALGNGGDLLGIVLETVAHTVVEEGGSLIGRQILREDIQFSGVVGAVEIVDGLGRGLESSDEFAELGGRAVEVGAQ